ncbi:hypothetical protein BDZ91DRAFT_802861 [Kalaharituber pfeilii]|nr:hypothetical protein BDZ91DRAFT_802861 [Kalaharituber pfeilii]
MFASAKAWTQFQQDGTINIPNMVTFLIEDPSIMEVISQEYDMYDWHYYPEGGPESRRGWLRNMYYSLVWQYPIILRMPERMESTGFHHFNLNVQNYLSKSCGRNAVQGSVSLGHEDEEGCTVLVKGFHRRLQEWWHEVENQLGAEQLPAGENTDMSKLYTGRDKAKLVEVVVHGIAVTKKLGKVREWMETANPWMGKIVAARWLVKKERREGKKASSVVIDLEGEVESDSQTPAKVRLSGKWYDSCLHDWDRNSKVDRKGKGREVEEMDLTA